MACRWFDEPTLDLVLVGVTGTNGKTTSTYLLEEVWKALGDSPGMIGTIEQGHGDRKISSSLTTPGPFELQKCLSQMKSSEVTHVGMEVSSIALDQYRVEGCAFDAGLFTNLTQDHLDYHGDMEGYFLSKKRFFTDFNLPVAVFNIDDVFGRELASEVEEKNRVTYSCVYPEADYFVTKLLLHQSGFEAVLATPQGTVQLRSALIGKHNLYNCLGVLAVSVALGSDIKAVLKVMELSKGAPGRLERVAQQDGRPAVFVDYAHTPDALSNVLSILNENIDEGKVITVFGCGGDRDERKRPLMARIASEKSAITIATSDNPRTEDPEWILDQVEKGIVTELTEYLRICDRAKAIHAALDAASPNDIVLIAGKGHEDYQIIGSEKLPFDDRQVVLDYYNTKN